MLKDNSKKNFLLKSKAFYLNVARMAYKISLWAEDKDHFIKQAEYFIRESELITKEI